MQEHTYNLKDVISSLSEMISGLDDSKSLLCARTISFLEATEKNNGEIPENLLSTAEELMASLEATAGAKKTEHSRVLYEVAGAIEERLPSADFLVIDQAIEDFQKTNSLKKIMDHSMVETIKKSIEGSGYDPLSRLHSIKLLKSFLQLYKPKSWDTLTKELNDVEKILEKGLTTNLTRKELIKVSTYEIKKTLEFEGTIHDKSLAILEKIKNKNCSNDEIEALICILNTQANKNEKEAFRNIVLAVSNEKSEKLLINTISLSPFKRHETPYLVGVDTCHVFNIRELVSFYNGNSPDRAIRNPSTGAAFSGTDQVYLRLFAKDKGLQFDNSEAIKVREAKDRQVALQLQDGFSEEFKGLGREQDAQSRAQAGEAALEQALLNSLSETKRLDRDDEIIEQITKECLNVAPLFHLPLSGKLTEAKSRVFYGPSDPNTDKERIMEQLSLWGEGLDRFKMLRAVRELNGMLGRDSYKNVRDLIEKKGIKFSDMELLTFNQTKGFFEYIMENYDDFLAGDKDVLSAREHALKSSSADKRSMRSTIEHGCPLVYKLISNDALEDSEIRNWLVRMGGLKKVSELQGWINDRSILKKGILDGRIVLPDLEEHTSIEALKKYLSEVAGPSFTSSSSSFPAFSGDGGVRERKGGDVVPPGYDYENYSPVNGNDSPMSHPSSGSSTSEENKDEKKRNSNYFPLEVNNEYSDLNIAITASLMDAKEAEKKELERGIAASLAHDQDENLSVPRDSGGLTFFNTPAKKRLAVASPLIGAAVAVVGAYTYAGFDDLANGHGSVSRVNDFLANNWQFIAAAAIGYALLSVVAVKLTQALHENSYGGEQVNLGSQSQTS